MSNDLVRRAVEISGGAHDADAMLQWLANIIRSLRDSSEAVCGHAGSFIVTEESGTVEINPSTRMPVGGYSNKALSFRASDALNGVLEHNALTDELLTALEHENAIASAFGKALATELVLNRRAAIGNFGVWTIGQKPNLERFVRFRPRPAINRML